jgi:hypothetical protein
MPPERLSQFKNTHPLPYPSAVKMNDEWQGNKQSCCLWPSVWDLDDALRRT